MNLLIRPAKSKDIKSLMLLEQSLFSKWSNMDSIDIIDKSWFLSKAHRERIESFIKSENKLIFVAEDNGKIVGYLKCEIVEREPFLKKVGYVSEAFVLSDYRGKGIGTKLLNKALEWFKKNKLKWTTASTHSMDEEAILFWEKKGYGEFNKFFKRKL